MARPCPPTTSPRWSPPSRGRRPRSCSWGSWSSLGRRVRELGETVDELRDETVPLVHDARVVVDQAATEMVRVGDVLDSAEAVSSTVDSASRLAYRAFSNPVVKILAYSTGVGSALRRFFGRPRGRSRGRRRRADGRARPDAPQRSRTPQRERAEAEWPAARRSTGATPRATSRCRGDPPTDVARRPERPSGSGGTVWTRRRLERLSQRVRPTAVATELASMVERTRRGAVRPGARRRSTRGGPRRSVVRTTCGTTCRPATVRRADTRR